MELTIRNSRIVLPDGVGRVAVQVISAIVLTFLLSATAFGQFEQNDEVKSVTRAFLDNWLIEADIEGALAFVAEAPVFPSCIVDRGEGGVKWGKTGRDAIKQLRRLFRSAAKTSKGEKLDEIIVRPKGILYSQSNGKPDFVRIN